MRPFVFLALALGVLCACTYSGENMRVDILNPAAKLYDEGMREYHKGNLNRARSLFNDIVTYYPGNGLADEALYMLATCYYEQGDYVNALAYYKQFLVRYPESSKASYVRSLVKDIEKKLKEEDHGGGGGGDNTAGNR